jgi:peptide/nickel transport system substrate-binding protein
MKPRRRTVLGGGAFLLVPDLSWATGRRGTLNAMFPAEPTTLNYPLLNTRLTQQICANINESLLLFDWQFKPHPNLAKSFEMSPDGLRYVFQLQPGVSWHDGMPFTAHDVVFTCDVMLRELNPRSRAALSHCESIRATGPLTVEFKLREPFNAFLFSFMASSAPMMPAHIYEGTNFRTNPFNLKPIGTGPFKFNHWERGQYIQLVRNEHYWRPGRPQLTDIYFRLCPTPEQRMVALETGAVDIAFCDDIDTVVTSRLLANPNLVSSSEGYNGVSEMTLLEVNQRLWPFSDRRFRAAFLHALDREFLVNAINFGEGKVAHSPIPSSTPYYDDKAVIKYHYDPARARALLDEMGLKPKARGVRHRFTLMKIPDGGGPWTRGCQYIKQAAAEVGLDIELQATDWATFSRRSGSWDFEMDCNDYGEYGDPAIGVSRFFVSSNIRRGVPQTNIQGYVNPEVDMLFARAASAIHHDDAQADYSRVQQILTRDVAMLWLYERKPRLFYNKRFRNIVTGPNGPCDGLGEVTLA